MLKKSLLAVAFISSLLFQGCTVEKADDANDMVASNEFVLHSIDNKQYVIKKTPSGFLLNGAKDKVLILDIFATWCPPCQASATHLTSLQKKYKNNLVVIGVTIESQIPNQKLKEFQKRYNANYILVNSDQNRLLIDAVAKKLNLGERFPIPMMSIYKNGKLVKYYLGAVEEEFIDSDIRNALK
ncbi:putative lipoprotein thioredoxin [hydrothermal vent metagenome]|uniref:Putative lipoprotein thioredoxin n=1 Tax=hydrothermal vent metagenome TaxID=652676 RepID=A0A1W1D577_9ZZZZ